MPVAALISPRQPREMFKQGIDTGIAGNDNLTAHSFAAEVCGIQLGRREQQILLRIDGNAKILLRPRIPPVVAAQARLHMRYRNPERGGGLGTAKGAGGVALNNDELCILEVRSDTTRDLTNMRIRIG